MSEGLEEIEILMLMSFLNLKKKHIFECKAPMDLKFIGELHDCLHFAYLALFYKRLEVKNSLKVENRVSMIKQILKHDILLVYFLESILGC